MHCVVKGRWVFGSVCGGRGILLVVVAGCVRVRSCPLVEEEEKDSVQRQSSTVAFVDGTLVDGVVMAIPIPPPNERRGGIILIVVLTNPALVRIVPLPIILPDIDIDDDGSR